MLYIEHLSISKLFYALANTEFRISKLFCVLAKQILGYPATQIDENLNGFSWTIEHLSISKLFYVLANTELSISKLFCVLAKQILGYSAAQIDANPNVEQLNIWAFQNYSML